MQKFDATGTTVLGEFNGAAAPTGPLNNPTDIAVDNSGNPLDPSENDVYVSGEVTVAGEPVHVIYKFSASGTYLGQITTGSGGAAFGELFGVAVDPAGELWVFQANGQIDNYTNDLENKFIESREDPRGPSPGFAVDTEDNLYVNTGNKKFAKLSSAGVELIEALGSEPSSAAAVDSENNDVYVDNVTSAGHFNASGQLQERFGGGDLSEGAGIAVNSTSANKLVYVVDRAGDAVRIFQEVLLPTVVTAAFSAPAPTGVTVNASVNPEGLTVTSCGFEFGTSSTYGQSAPCEASPGSGGAPVAVAARLTGLQRGVTYHYRVFAGNENGTSVGTDETFTLGPVLVREEASDVSADAVSFDATINAHNVPTTYYFQYGTSTAYGTNAPAPPGRSLPPGEGDVEVSPEHVQGLSPDTLYHYRVVMLSGAEEFPGPDQSFTTQGLGGGLVLPDARAWELVSPAEKGGGVLEPIVETGVVEASESGGTISYLANAPTEAGAQGNAGRVQVLSRRGAAGWSTSDIASAHQSAPGNAAGTAPEYRFFTNDLSAAIVQPFGLFNPQLAPEEGSEQTPYVRSLSACASSCYRPLVSGKAGHANVPAGTQFGEERLCEEENGISQTIATICGPLFLGATVDLSHVLLSSEAALVGGAGAKQIYEWAGGSLQLISVLAANEAGEELPAPSGPGAREHPFLGAGFGEAHGSAKRAISADGRRVFWESEATLYMRDSEKQKTIELDAAEAACLEEVGSTCQSGAGRFQIASVDGSRALFSDTQRLSKDAGANGSSDLYECQIVAGPLGKPACELTDLTPAHGGESANVQGNVLGASEDGETVYFVAEGILSAGANARGEHASAGQPNLYVRRGGQTVFIATLAEGDGPDWSTSAEEQPTRASANGQWLAFMSERPLTGYDNRDALSGKPDAEVYLYDGQAGKLECASCNPSGARPLGVEYAKLESADNGELLVSGHKEWRAAGWVAALTPESVSFSRHESAYQGRYLSNQGRLFFNALDALVPQDVNGNWDVFEHEPTGVGNCSEEAAGFDGPSEGCLGLVSSGASAQESAFLDASQSGGDVFFLSSARLTPEDFDANRDVYDAHECTSSSPCIPTKPVSSPPCATEASCRPSPTPQPQIFGAPASATFSGPGNPTALHSSLIRPKAKSKSAKCKRGLLRKHDKCVKAVRHERKGKKYRAKKGSVRS